MISFFKKHTSYIFSFLFVLGILFSITTYAAPTQQTLGFQGEFFNYGTPGNTPVQATFTFHTTETGNTPSGSTITKIIPVVHGYFATEFTDTDTQGVDFNQQLYLEISINGTTLAPRTPVRPSVASFKTFGTFSHATPPTPGIAGSLYFNTTTNELYVSTGSSWQLAGTASTTIQWTPNGTSLNYMAGNVGVGTSNPSEKLVVGDDLGDVTTSATTILVGNTSGLNAGVALGSGSTTRSWYEWISGGNYLRWGIYEGGSVYQDNLVLRKGMVGINNNNPGAQLDIRGDLQSAGIRIRTNGPQGTSYVDFGNSATHNAGSIYYNNLKHSLAFKTNGVDDRMIITSGGDIGIGTATPTAINLGRVLHLQNTSNTNTAADNSEIRIESNNRTAFLHLIAGANSASAINFGIAGTPARGVLNYNQATNNMSFSTAAVERLRIDSNGNVGIGTTTPTQKLSVLGGLTAGNTGLEFSVSSTTGAISQFLPVNGDYKAQYVKNTDAGTTTLSYNYFTNNLSRGVAFGITSSNFSLYGTSSPTFGVDQTFLWNNNSGGMAITSAAGAGVIKFVTGGDTLAHERMRITSSGNVGIGATSTAVVGGWGSDDRVVTIMSQNSNNEGIIELVGRSAINQEAVGRVAFIHNGYAGRAEVQGYRDVGNAQVGLRFITADTVAMTINNSGNIGIGTTTPTTKLSIDGDFKIKDLVFRTTIGSKTLFIGENAGVGATNAIYSNFIGDSAGQDATSAIFSNFFGNYAGYQASSSAYSNFFGQFAGFGAANALYSNFIGQGAGNSAVNARNSNFIGWQAGRSATNASYSNFIGQNAGNGAFNAANSIIIGNDAGYYDSVNNTSGNKSSILIGNYTSTGGFSNSIAIGQGTMNSASEQLNIGRILYATGIASSTAASAVPLTDARLGVGTSTPSAQLTTTGTVRFASLGSGGANLITDSLGNVTVSSDERLKDIQGDYISGLDQIKGIQPITYRWKTETGYDTIATYAGFSAQNVQQFIPEAVTTDSRGFLTLADRPILATLVNAVKELAGKVSGFATSFTSQEIKTEKLCIGETCVTEEQLKSLLLQGGTTQQTNTSNIGTQDEPVVDIVNDEEEVIAEEPVPEPEPVVEPEVEPAAETPVITD